jgi:hypothetical protein
MTVHRVILLGSIAFDYGSRPSVATERLALTSSGQVRYQLKTPYRDGTTHNVMEPLDLMVRLAALIPPPPMHLTRYRGVFTPHSRLRARVTPAKRGVGAIKSPAATGEAQPFATPRHVAMNWARRLKRVFGVEIEDCARCGGKLKIIASIEEAAVPDAQDLVQDTCVAAAETWCTTQV